MSYILAFLIPAAFLAILHFTTELTMQKKATIIASLAAIIASAIYYNSLQAEVQEHTIKTTLFYKQNKTIVCHSVDLNKDVNVTKKDFSFSRGTHTFIGRENSDYYNLMITISECR